MRLWIRNTFECLSNIKNDVCVHNCIRSETFKVIMIFKVKYMFSMLLSVKLYQHLHEVIAIYAWQRNVSVRTFWNKIFYFDLLNYK